ncbi:hypothetical protein D1N53_24020, partial [Clostridioides difficile]
VKRLSRFVLNDEEAFAKELQVLWNEKQTEKPKHNKSELQRFQRVFSPFASLGKLFHAHAVLPVVPFQSVLPVP